VRYKLYISSKWKFISSGGAGGGGQVGHTPRGTGLGYASAHFAVI